MFLAELSNRSVKPYAAPLQKQRRNCGAIEQMQTISVRWNVNLEGRFLKVFIIGPLRLYFSSKPNFGIVFCAVDAK